MPETAFPIRAISDFLVQYSGFDEKLQFINWFITDNVIRKNGFQLSQKSNVSSEPPLYLFLAPAPTVDVALATPPRCGDVPDSRNFGFTGQYFGFDDRYIG